MPALRVELSSAEGAAAHEQAWRALAARALEANVFAEPAFIFSAFRHLGGARRLRLLLVWSDADKRLVGAMVLRLPRHRLIPGVARVWQSEQAGLAALMLDREAGAVALEAALDWIARQQPAIVGLLAPTLAADGPTAAALRAIGRRRGLRYGELTPRSRAALIHSEGAPAGFEASLPKKRLKEWSRQLRRLRERGALAFGVAADGAAIEKFLALEARGWKGDRRTALSAEIGRAAFARSMLEGFARDGRLAIHTLALNGEPLAIGVALRGGDRAFYWKTAYAEAYAEFSPGVQLTLEMSRALQRDARIAMTDSCAIEGHPMIERLWPARLALVDCLVATRPETARRLAVWSAGEAVRRRLRHGLKLAIHAWRRRG